MIGLRAYQETAIQIVRQYLLAAILRVLLVLPTGAGKTVVAAHIISATVANGFRVLFVAHRKELIKQAFCKLVRDGLPPEKVGVIMATIETASGELWPDDPATLTDDELWRRYGRRRPGAPVQVASIATLVNRAWPLADLVVVDEAHHALAESYTKLQTQYPDAAHLGLTATPYRGNGEGLGPAYDQLVVCVTREELMAQGHLVEPRIFTVPASELPDLSRVKIKAGDYDPTALGVACDQGGLVGNIVEHWKERAEGRRTFLFAASVEHSKHCAERFRNAGIVAEHLDGTTDPDEREAMLARIARGETLVICNYGVLTEGVDVPPVKCCILARPTRNKGLVHQCAGRILRPWEGVGALILDHSGCMLDHWFDATPPTLEDAPKKKSGSGAPPAKTCENCYAIVAAAVRVCPACGETFPDVVPERNPEEAEGKLVEVTAATIADKRAAWDRLCVEWAKDNAWRESHGQPTRKPGWIWHRYLEVSGGEKPPPGCRLPGATDEDTKNAALAKLIAIAKAKGIPESWAHRKIAKQFPATQPTQEISQ